jgi:MFS family permease
MSFYLYSVNLRGNVVPFLQAEFARGDRAVSLHAGAIAVGIILVGLLGDRVEAGPWRRRTLRLGIGGLAGGGTLLCLAPAPSLGQRPATSIAAWFLMGPRGGLDCLGALAGAGRKRHCAPAIRRPVSGTMRP